MIGGAEGSDGIRSGDIRSTPTEVLREETLLPCGTGSNINSICPDAFVSSRTIDVKPSIPIGSDGNDHPPKKAIYEPGGANCRRQNRSWKNQRLEIT
ncbi:hypothetical protein HID58_002265 [Brassica napus]|uniref:Uncharacterized protein n=1 Tax=Brassica napus TaxID=3708 RepID=A0ABQ8ELU4_BRANA|nr:hypothetical protein HID58_002265 [Brassica napus]